MIAANLSCGGGYYQVVGHKHSKEQILSDALSLALDEGLSQLTFGRLARRLGISDRIIVYYFPTKADLIGEVIGAMGQDLQEAMTEAFAEPASSYTDMIEQAWPLLATPTNDRVFALFLEANGLAAVGVEPYATIVPGLVEGWISWAATLADGSEADARTQAATAVAVIDGLVLLRLLAGAEAAERAVSLLTRPPNQ